jgi:hypothetical protein
MKKTKIIVVTEDEWLWEGKAITLMANIERIQTLADVLNESDEDWSYVVETHGCCYDIAVYDEDDLFLGWL